MGKQSEDGKGVDLTKDSDVQLHVKNLNIHLNISVSRIIKISNKYNYTNSYQTRKNKDSL